MSTRHTNLNFNTGRFQMFADGELRADFFDSHFDKISLIGFLLMGNSEIGGSQGWADSFMISGPSILNRKLRDKLVTTWGKIKRSK